MARFRQVLAGQPRSRPRVGTREQTRGAWVELVKLANGLQCCDQPNYVEGEPASKLGYPKLSFLLLKKKVMLFA
jgi:hypothetical protein